ncbi:MAG: TIR domain-containing protein [Zoogloeaceae bacterium]|jgi:hypothetical protein|nr:TIR domain-containing protein [Zoogloeaceae bacterium]
MSEKNRICQVLPCHPDHDSFVFVSYAHQDSAQVFPIIEQVSAGGYAIWYDKGINISSVWTDDVAIAIMNCKVFIVFVSKNAVNSPYVRSEVEFALNHQIRIIPVYLDGMEILPPGLALGLSSTQGILDTRNAQGVAEQICNALDYNKIKKEDEAGHAERAAPPAKNKKYRTPAIWGAGGLAVIILAALLVFRGSGDAPLPLPEATPVVAPQRPDALPPQLAADDPAQQDAPDTSSVAALPPENAIVPNVTAPAGTTVALSAKGKFALEKAAFAPAEPIYVNLPRFPKETEDLMQKQGAMIGVALANAAQGKYLTHEFIASFEARIKLRAPLEAGAYEVRWYDNGSVLTKASLLGAARFAVQGNSRNAFAVKVEKTAYAPREQSIVQVSSVPKRLIDDGALVGVFRENAAPDEFVVYQPIRARDEQIRFDAPNTPGEYEIRGHINNFLLDEPTLVTRTSFVVLEAEAQERAP